jgi:hypothetical protein
MWRHGPGNYTNLCNSCGVKWRRGKILSSGDNRHHLCKPATPSKVAKKKAKTPSPVRKPLVTPPDTPEAIHVELPPTPTEIAIPLVFEDPLPKVMESIQEPPYSRLELLTNDFTQLLERLQPRQTTEFITALTQGYSVPFGEMNMNVMDITEEKWERLRSLVW